MRLSILLLLTLMASCSPKISTINSTTNSTDSPISKSPDPRFIIPEQVYYFFENNQWVEGVPDSIDHSLANKNFLRELYMTIRYPAIARESGIQGAVILFVEQDETGQVISSEIKREIGGGCGEAGLSALRAAAQRQRLTPITKNGIPMRARYDYPIRFKLE